MLCVKGDRMIRPRSVACGVVALGMALAFALYGYHRLAENRGRQERQRAYEEAVVSFRRALPRGTTREQVVAFLQRSRRPVVSMCCMQSSRPPNTRVLDVLTRVGVERPPFHCSEHNVYVGFEFEPSQEGPISDDAPSDRLVEVRLYHWFLGCL